MKNKKTLNFVDCDLTIYEENGVFSHANVNWNNRNLVNYTIKSEKEAIEFLNSPDRQTKAVQSYSF